MKCRPTSGTKLYVHGNTLNNYETHHRVVNLRPCCTISTYLTYL